MSEKREAPLARVWNRAKAKAPRQKAIAATTATVRRAKPRTERDAREALITEAAKHRVTDLSEKELQVMTDAVVMSAREAASQAATKGISGVKSLWASLQTATPTWVELPDNVAALNIRSDQTATAVAVEVDAPDVLARLDADLAPESAGTRSFDCWLSWDEPGQTAEVHVGQYQLGHLPPASVEPIRQVLLRRNAWTPAQLHAGTVTVQLPDRQ